ncbi:MAG: hypothetical protein ACREJ0_21150, partial [Geminicoccaceae bacterium]
MNKGTPSVRIKICSTTSAGITLPPATLSIMAVPWRRVSRESNSCMTWSRPIQGGLNSGRKVRIA